MPDGTWWTVNDSLMRIISGPYLWDGVTPIGLPSGQRAVNTEPTTMGYTWPMTSVADTVATLALRLTALEARLVTEARGIKPTPALTLGQTLTTRVTLKTPVRTAAGVPTTSYTPTALLIQGPSISSMRITAEPTVVDAQNVDVPITSTLGVSLGAANILVFADLK